MELPHDILTGRVKAAAGAAWWTLLIMVILLTLSWLGVLFITSHRPEWASQLWGGGKIDWDQVHVMYLWFFGAMKMILWIVFILAVWLSIWGCKLRRLGR
ncbi:MAG: hypothetical protein ABFD92_00720 [Planctomycetaceae bacterium]|nr:hypothetical protein [Planctomycetaceae bacterium]